MSSQSGLINLSPVPEGKISFLSSVSTGISRPCLWEERGPAHKVNLSPALDPLSRAIVPSPVGKVFSGGPQLGLFSEWDFQRKCHLFFSSTAFPLGAAFSTPLQEAHTPSLMRRCQLLSQGVHRGGPLGPSSSQVHPGASPQRSWILPFMA
jgi:hypothetical protein